MSLVDNYISQIDNTIDASDDHAISNLVKEIVSVFSGSDPHIKTGLDRYRGGSISPGMTNTCDDIGDLKKLRGKLLVLKENERVELESDPMRLALSSVDDDIDECKHLIDVSDDKSARAFIDRMVQVYGNDIKNIAIGLSCHGLDSEEENLKSDLTYIGGHLKHYRAKLAALFSIGTSNTVNVQANAENRNTVENVLTVTQVAERVQSVPESVLNKDLKKELKCMLLDLEAVKNKPKAEAESRVKKILAWMADKGVDVAIAALPYIVNVLSTLSS